LRNIFTTPQTSLIDFPLSYVHQQLSKLNLLHNVLLHIFIIIIQQDKCVQIVSWRVVIHLLFQDKKSTIKIVNINWKLFKREKIFKHTQAVNPFSMEKIGFNVMTKKWKQEFYTLLCECDTSGRENRKIVDDEFSNFVLVSESRVYLIINSGWKTFLLRMRFHIQSMSLHTMNFL
jgi:hypothetical protein